MDPKIWGPHAWFFMHSITLGYPDKPTNEDKIWMKQFFESVGHVLPCMKCRNNYREHMNKLPLDNTVLLSRENLVKWLIDVHNEVNIKNSKPVVTHESAIESFINGNKQGQNPWISVIIVIIIIILIMVPFIIKYISK